VIATVPVGVAPRAVALNPVTNKIYVANEDSLNVTVIDGVTLSTTAIAVGVAPATVVVDPLTNKIYVTNVCGNDPNCSSDSDGTVTVIDGATLTSQTIVVSIAPRATAVNSITNKVYVANQDSNTVTVIDGATNNTTTIAVGLAPIGVAVNTVTNKIYVVNSSSRTVTVIDGATNGTTTIHVPIDPSYAVAVNSITNRIYLADDLNTVAVIDGVTNNVTEVVVGSRPFDLAVNPMSNKIYVANYNSNDVTVIDGATNNTTTVPVGTNPGAVGVNPVTNKIYVVNEYGNTVTMIDGATNDTTTVAVGLLPLAEAVDPLTNRIYVANYFDSTVSVIAGADSTAAQFVAVTPCRLYDTRPQYGGSGPIPGGTSETFNLPQLAQSKGCADLSTAVAYSLNVAVVPHGGYLGYLTMWPTGEDQPLVATLNSLDGRIKANAAILPAGYQGAINVYVTNTTDVILDIDAYFAPVSGSTLAFYPLSPPCRVADTRSSMFPSGLGTPHLSGGAQRDFPALSSTCGIPSTAQGYSLNLAAIPYPALGYPLGYLEVWPKGQRPQPPVSTLNNLTGTIVANAALVPAGTGGEITVYPSNDTDLVIDANGYFAPAGTGGLSLYPAAPCRVIDTRKIGSGQPFSGTLTPPVDVVDSQCAPPSTAQAYVFNATVVPSGGLGYLTLWSDSLDSGRPTVATLNAIDGWITNNMAIVPNINGKTDAYASGITQLILDISSYFAP
jgi:YVTN family beta-propeller protein